MLLSQVLGGTAGSRIWMRLREREGLSYTAGSWAYADSFDSAGGIGISAIVAPQNLAKAKASLLDEVTRMQTGTIDPDELAKAKASWVKDLDTNLSSDSYVVDMLASEAYKGRTTEFTKDLRAKIEALTPADIERVAKAHLDAKRLIVVDAG
jgi:zinc protease